MFIGINLNDLEKAQGSGDITMDDDEMLERVLGLERNQDVFMAAVEVQKSGKLLPLER